MLAKVLKNEEVSNFVPFTIPEITDGQFNGGAANFPAPRRISASTPDDILQQARDEAARIIAQAEENSSLIHQVAEDKALHETNLKLEARVAERVSEMRDRLADTIERISSLSGELTTGVETSLVELALQIAKKIVRREVTIDREVALTLVKVSLAKLHDRSIAEIHLNPEDFTYVQAHREKLGFRGALEIIEDPLVSVGGCLIHTETGDIDARIESQFEEIAHGLLGV
jgi:flagellar assembly protein FliH